MAFTNLYFLKKKKKSVLVVVIWPQEHVTPNGMLRSGHQNLLIQISA